MNIQNTSAGNLVQTNDLLFYVWAGIVIVYLVFGGIWLVRNFESDETDIGERY